MTREFINDLREYGLGVAWYNLRFNLAHAMLPEGNWRLTRTDVSADD